METGVVKSGGFSGAETGGVLVDGGSEHRKDTVIY